MDELLTLAFRLPVVTGPQRLLSKPVPLLVALKMEDWAIGGSLLG